MSKTKDSYSLKYTTGLPFYYYQDMKDRVQTFGKNENWKFSNVKFSSKWKSKEFGIVFIIWMNQM